MVKRLGFRVQGLGFRVSGLGFKVWDLGLIVQDLSFKSKSSGFGFQEYMIPVFRD